MYVLWLSKLRQKEIHILQVNTNYSSLGKKKIQRGQVLQELYMLQI